VTVGVVAVPAPGSITADATTREVAFNRELRKSGRSPVIPVSTRSNY
jgi:hypothetical protein